MVLYASSNLFRADLFRTFVIDDGNVVWGEDWDLIFPIENLYIGKAA